MVESQKRKKRSRNLDDETILEILKIIDGFSGKLTYALLIDQIELKLKARYTRQSLHRHERIRLAFGTKRKNVSNQARPRPSSPAKQIESQTIERLRSENARLSAENDALIQKFTRWSYNAFTRGLDEAFLDRPLPRIDRGKTPDRS